MRIRIKNITGPLKYLNGRPVRIIKVRQAKTVSSKPATVTPILKALEYKQRKKALAKEA